MKKALVLVTCFLLASCVSIPPSVMFNGESVKTFEASAGCGAMMLDTDCSQISGSTREIEIEGIKLRVCSGEKGKIRFVMSMSKFMPDEGALIKGSKAIEKLLKSKRVTIVSTKVMYGSGTIFGVHYSLDDDGYSYLKNLSI